MARLDKNTEEYKSVCLLFENICNPDLHEFLFIEFNGATYVKNALQRRAQPNFLLQGTCRVITHGVSSTNQLEYLIKFSSSAGKDIEKYILWDNMLDFKKFTSQLLSCDCKYIAEQKYHIHYLRYLTKFG